MKRRVFFKTLGCRLNQAEEGDFAEQFRDAGWEISELCPDVVVLHSCAVTRRAERETFRILRALRRRHESALLVVTGCAIACNDAALFREAGADMLVPKASLHELSRRILEVLASRAKISGCILSSSSSDISVCGSAFPLRVPFFSTKRALLKVQDGCDFNCSYCVVPRTRGAAISRPWRETMDLAARLLKSGFRELVLTGCNLACYASDGHNLPELADAICALADDFGARIRLGSLEPGICDDELAGLLARRRNLCKFLHFPIQSGDSAVLSAAGRIYDAERIVEMLSRFRREVPLVSLNGDFITGLPGEDEAAFLRTCEIIARFEFSNAHIFPYSPRQGTRALAQSRVPLRAVAKERAARLRHVANASGTSYRRKLLGEISQVLIEGRDASGMAFGWNGEYVRCVLSAQGVAIASLTSFRPQRVDESGILS